MKILVVDDSELVLQRLLERLGELDFIDRIFKANSYNEAIELVHKHKPHIVLLDIQMPEKNGLELLSFIKQNYPDIITIMLTNRVSDYYKDLCKSIGANDFIDKSSEFEKIPGIIESYMPEEKY